MPLTLLSGIEDLREKREEVNRQILRQEEEKAKIQKVRLFELPAHRLRQHALTLVDVHRAAGSEPPHRATLKDQREPRAQNAGAE